MLIKRRVWEDETSEWYIEYRSCCPTCECMTERTQPALVVWHHPQTNYGSIFMKCWHPRRFLRRTRSITDCLCAALDYIETEKARDQALRDEADLLIGEASEIAETARIISRVMHEC